VNISEVNDMYATAKGGGRGKLYVWVKDGQKSWPCFDPKLFEALRGQVNETVTLRMAEGSKGKHIVGIVSEPPTELEQQLKASIAAVQANKQLEVGDEEIPF
jgi:hypothetical protein